MAMTLEDAERVFRPLAWAAEASRRRAVAGGVQPQGAADVGAGGGGRGVVGLVSGALLLGGRRLAHQAGPHPARRLAGAAGDGEAPHRRPARCGGRYARRRAHEARRAILARTAYVLARQALQKEGVVYPALRSEGNGGAAKSLAADQFRHQGGVVRPVGGRSQRSALGGKAWRALRKMVDQLSAAEAKALADLHEKLTPKANARIMRAINREGDRLA